MLSHAMKLGRSASVIPLARQQRVNAIGGMNCVVSQWTSPSSFHLQSRRMNSGEAIKSPVVDTVVTSLHPHYPAVESITTLTNSPPDLILNLIESTHIGMQIPYWESIVLLTIGMRCIMLPIGIKTAQSSARMAAVRPLLTKVTDAMKRDPNAGTAARKKQYADQSKELLKSYKVNPFLSLAMPFVQLPVFMSCFFALQVGTTYALLCYTLLCYVCCAMFGVLCFGCRI
jgi:membrane protein insertase Oxa1/YidC/SpoIIIJ